MCLKTKPLNKKLLQEAHESKFTVHLGNTKMYQNLKQYYRWPNMRKEVAGYVAKCSVCQQVKVEYQKPIGLLQLRLSIPFRFARNGWNIPSQFKKQNKMEQFSSHFKSRSVPDFSAGTFRFHSTCFIPHLKSH